jgi:putative transposase
MFNLSLWWFGAFVRLFRSRGNLVFENLVLRQQLAMLKGRRQRPSLSIFDKLFWVAVRRFWSKWKEALIVVTPETVVRWRRAGFQIYWRLISKVRRQVGRRQTPKEVRELIFRMVTENPTWGAVLRKNSMCALESFFLVIYLAICTVVFHSSEPRCEVASSSTQSSSV